MKRLNCMLSLVVTGMMLGTLAACNDGAKSAKEPKAEEVDHSEPRVMGRYSQCAYPASAPKVDLVREIDMRGIIMPSFGGVPPVVPALANGRLGVWFFLGQRPTSGYNIEFDQQKSGIEGNELTLWFEEIKPNPDKRYTQSLTSPCILLSIADTSFTKLTANGDISGLPISLALE